MNFIYCSAFKKKTVWPISHTFVNCPKSGQYHTLWETSHTEVNFIFHYLQTYQRRVLCRVSGNLHRGCDDVHTADLQVWEASPHDSQRYLGEWKIYQITDGTNTYYTEE